MKKLLLFLMLFTTLFSMEAAKKAEEIIPEYQIEGAGPSKGDEVLVRVWIVTKDKNKVTDKMLQTVAVHGVLFKGYNDASNQSAIHRALAGSPVAYKEYIDFFEPFFADGDATNYARLVDDQRKTLKSGKDYKVGAVVRVSTGQLKQDLQRQNINVIRSLKSGW